MQTPGHWILAIGCWMLISSCQTTAPTPLVPPNQEEARAHLRGMSGYVAIRRGETAIIDFNRNATLTDDDLRYFAVFPGLTDISAEQTAITDAGIAHLRGLRKVEWLNLYQTKIGDGSLEVIGDMRRLQQLPIGETKITDKGLKHLAGLNELHYLGLRGTAVSDRGIDAIVKITNLKAVHLGETRITDAGVKKLAPLKLSRLWLHDTAVTDGCIPTLAGMTTLRELYVANTGLTPEGLIRLQQALPKCEIVH